jgi:hypothetical protein
VNYTLHLPRPGQKRFKFVALLRAVHPDTVAMADYGRGYNMAKRFRFEVNLRNATIRVPIGDWINGI